MASSALCPGCLAGDHTRHITSWKPTPPGAIGGFMCLCWGACQQRAAGVIVTAEDEVKRLGALYKRWDIGALTNVEMAALITRIAKKLEKACFCDEGVCCRTHDNHASPHRNCFFR